MKFLRGITKATRIRIVLGFFGIVSLVSLKQYSPVLLGTLTETALVPSAASHEKEMRPKGVFVLKVMRAQHATQALCFLTHFFNNGPKYPVRIFADYNYTNETIIQLEAVSGGADVQVIVNTASWKQFPPTLNTTELAEVEANCDNLQSPETATCTKLKVGLGYVYMGYWRYMKMASELSLADFEYFISFDADSYLTKPMPDPFQLMARNNLSGIFNIEGYQRGSIAKGIQEAAESMFSLQERQNRYVDSPEHSYFNSDGQWERKGQDGYPSIWGCFYGGRLDFFRTDRYIEYARAMSPYTYIYRTDEQPVIGVAWSVLGKGEKIWYLPKRNISMGVFHHGWVDNSEIIRLSPANHTDNQTYWLHTLDQWRTFGGESYGELVGLNEYIDSLGYDEDDQWRTCLNVCNKEKCQPSQV